MGDSYPKYKAAAVMAAPVFLDREATTEKACTLIREAGGNGAELIVFPETYIPAYPYWIWLDTPVKGREFFKELYKNAVEMDSPTIREIGRAAKDAKAYVAMGMNEREGGTLYNTLVYFDKAGEVIGRHRKLQPTNAERMIWGRGDGSDIKVFDTELGGLGGLICWEHSMDLIRYSMLGLGEQVHIAVWPAGSSMTHHRNTNFFNTASEAYCKQHAIAGQTFVICVQGVVDDLTLERLGCPGGSDTIQAGGGWSAIIGPDGGFRAGPQVDEEGILYGDIDFEDIIAMKYTCDAVGHYARPDIAKLMLNLEPQQNVEKTDPGQLESGGDSPRLQSGTDDRESER